jgi:hypothetical protein
VGAEHDSPRPVDDATLRPVRDFLAREFRDWLQLEYFDVAEDAMMFVLETDQGRQHTLAVPVETFKDADFMRLCNAELAEAIKLAQWRRVTLTPNGVRLYE